jgi:hypothetical protein
MTVAATTKESNTKSKLVKLPTHIKSLCPTTTNTSPTTKPNTTVMQTQKQRKKKQTQQETS